MNHTIVHFEIPADDPEKLADFYSNLFGWKIQKMTGMPGMEDVDYWTVGTVPTDDKGMPTEPGVNGGMMKRQTPDQRPTNYISVESVAEYVQKAKSLGAKVALDKMPVPGMGWFAQIVDPQGNVIALWETDQSAK